MYLCDSFIKSVLEGYIFTASSFVVIVSKTLTPYQNELQAYFYDGISQEIILLF